MRIYNGRNSFYQWDTNQKLIHNFKAGDEVHFANMITNPLTASAYELDGMVVVDVPNILLQYAYPIHVYWVYIDQYGQYTRDEFVVNVTKRPKPSGYVYTETEVMTYKSLDERITALEEHDTTTYRALIGEVELLSAKWEGGENLYHQVVTIEGVTENSQVDITPNVEQLVIFYEKDLTFVTENDGGIVTVYAIGQKPENDYTLQVTITEVNV